MMICISISESLFQTLSDECCDVNSCVILDSKVANELENDWCLVSAKSKPVKWVYRKIVISKTPIQFAVFTHTSLFNVGNFNVREISIRKCTTKFESKIANTAEICAITENVKETVLDEALYNYFKIPKYFYKNDVFFVDIHKYNEAAAVYKCEEYTPKHIYLKVTKIASEDTSSNDEGFLISHETTLKFSNSSTQSFLPPHDKIQDYCSSNLSNLSSIVPSGFEDYFKEIKSWICPFLQQDIQNLKSLKPVFLIHGPRGSGKSNIISNAATTFGLHYVRRNCIFIQNNNIAQCEAQISNLFQKIPKLSPCILHLSNIEALCEDDTGQKNDRVMNLFTKLIKSTESQFPLIIICTTSNIDKISPSIRRIFLKYLEIQSLLPSQRLNLIQWLVKREGFTINFDLNEIAQSTSGYLFYDLIQLVVRTIELHLKDFYENKTTGKVVAEAELTLQDLVVRTIELKLKDFYENKTTGKVVAQAALTLQDFSTALNEMKTLYSDSIGAPEVPNVSWDDIGGLVNLKQEIITSLELRKHPDGPRRSGLLLHGPPGTGKTLLAKAVATECKSNFISIKGPELLNMYVGQSEKNVREVFARAKASLPCVIFFDELDSLAPRRNQTASSGRSMDRVVSQLLIEMDGLQKSKDLFVLAATNRPDLIDPALLRPGRLDKMLYVGFCTDIQSKISVLKALTKKFKLEENFELSSIIDLLPKTDISGADLYGICSRAWLNAARKHIHNSCGDEKKMEDLIIVSRNDFVNALSPSLQKYK